MLDVYLALGAGAGLAIGQYFSDRRLENEFYQACEENKKLFDRLNNPDKTSKLVKGLKVKSS